MSSLAAVGIGLVGGIGLGLFFFGGLWWTVQRLPMARRPVSVSLSSFAARTLLTLAGIYLVTQGSWQRLGGCLLGFFAARAALLFILSPKRDMNHKRTRDEKSPETAPETRG